MVSLYISLLMTIIVLIFRLSKPQRLLKQITSTSFLRLIYCTFRIFFLIFQRTARFHCRTIDVLQKLNLWHGFSEQNDKNFSAKLCSNPRRIDLPHYITLNFWNWNEIENRIYPCVTRIVYYPLFKLVIIKKNRLPIHAHTHICSCGSHVYSYLFVLISNALDAL